MEETEISTADDGKQTEAIAALQVLGYNRKEVEKAIESINTKDLTVEDIIKKGLLLLSN